MLALALLGAPMLLLALFLFRSYVWPMLGRPLFALLGFFTPSASFWQMVDTQGIVCFVGPNGSGKSLAMVHAALAALDGMTWECIDPDHRHHDGFAAHLAGCEDCGAQLHRFRRASTVADVAPWLCDGGAELLAAGAFGQRLVYSTVALLAEDGRDHPMFRPLRDYRQLLRLEHVDVLFDEVAGVSDASDSSSVPVQVVNWLHQLRKRDVRLRVTTPAYSRCSKPVRQVCQTVVDARSFWPERRTSGRLWRPRRGFMFVAYDAFQFEDFTSSTVRAVEAETGGRSRRKTRQGRAVLWRPGCRAERTYNTLGQVLALGHVTESGMCSFCGGSRSRPKCACPADQVDVEGLVVVERVTPTGTRTRTVEPGESAA